MGFRFNKTFKQKQDPLDTFLENNPNFKMKYMKENLTLKGSFEEKNISKMSMAISKWKLLGIVASPICCFIAFSVYNYADPVQIAIVKEKEQKVKDKEKEILEGG